MTAQHFFTLCIGEFVSAESMWFAVGVVGMSIGWASFAKMGADAPKDEKIHYVVSLFIALTAAAMYLLMAQGYSHVALPDGHAFWLARYLDWAVTTPLLLLGLASAVMPSPRTNGSLVASLMGADLLMIVAGTIGSAISGNEAARWTWFLVSCAAFLVVLALIYGPLKAEATAAGRGKAFAKLAGFLTVLWFIYPIVWVLGNEGLRVIGSTVETGVITIVDVTAKVVYGFVTLTTVRGLAGGAVRSTIGTERTVRTTTAR